MGPAPKYGGLSTVLQPDSQPTRMGGAAMPQGLEEDGRSFPGPES